jgi:hypothetical protein
VLDRGVDDDNVVGLRDLDDRHIHQHFERLDVDWGLVHDRARLHDRRSPDDLERAAPR